MSPASGSSVSKLHRLPKVWLKIVLEVSPDMTDAAATVLATLTGSGVEISSPKNSVVGEVQLERIIGYLCADEGKQHQEIIVRIQNLLSDLEQYFPDNPPPGMFMEKIGEEDWRSGWKKYFKTFRVTPRIIVKPSWQRYEPNIQKDCRADEIVIEMDPGLAFGTGHHASTRLALTLVEEIFSADRSKPRRVLDVGTGTAILAMSCALFGAEEVLAIDNDPDAVAAARSNVVRNGLEKSVRVEDKEITALASSYDLILANITHDVLIVMASTLNRLLSPGGRLILSGILQEKQQQTITTTYSDQGLVLFNMEKSEEWVALAFKKGID